MKTVYEQLQERLDKFPQGYPKTESGVEIKILEKIFKPDEAELALHLRPNMEPVSAIAKRLNRDAKELGDKLYAMSRKGQILRFRAPGDNLYYALAPFVIGIWEFQLNNLDKELVDMVMHSYYYEGMKKGWDANTVQMTRVITVEKNIPSDLVIHPYERVSRFLETSDRFAVAECLCRKESKISGRNCSKMLEACMTFGVGAAYSIENGMAREITKEEARSILIKAEEDGLVHCSYNHAGFSPFICNCCGCCCGILRSLSELKTPNMLAKSNFYVEIDGSACTGCEVCLDRCQMKAIEIEDDHAVVSLERCIGCGLCVSTCPGEAIQLKRKGESEIPVIAADQHELIQWMAKGVGKPYPFE
ncbi:MAG: 4Fe-4S dicluster domain-containing protein [Candidatus Tectomicrobia bacterium]|uniref:4Fe-4S dicluster domain-containing protein n=1 Tax=Tectimicrobiota bacterium TaxID=2528274 RepID=A0A933GMQ3_UNCTE|nr:4Fe-4S dicluster domain-containing protein [Candidatus Tectomicrobia bacterium]